jgi:hypothetical protein
VALAKGSLVVNSSQGGGSKDTWVIGGSQPAPVTAPVRVRAEKAGPPMDAGPLMQDDDQEQQQQQQQQQ